MSTTKYEQNQSQYEAENECVFEDIVVDCPDTITAYDNGHGLILLDDISKTPELCECPDSQDAFEFNENKDYYESEELAAIEAAKRIYDRYNANASELTANASVLIGEEKKNRKKQLAELPSKSLRKALEQCEYGIAVFKDGEKGYLLPKEDDIRVGTKNSVSMSIEGISDNNLEMVAFVHSHPYNFDDIGQTFSTTDMIAAYRKQINIYLIYGYDKKGNDLIADKGELMRFIPPPKLNDDPLVNANSFIFEEGKLGTYGRIGMIENAYSQVEIMKFNYEYSLINYIIKYRSSDNYKGLKEIRNNNYYPQIRNLLDKYDLEYLNYSDLNYDNMLRDYNKNNEVEYNRLLNEDKLKFYHEFVKYKKCLRNYEKLPDETKIFLPYWDSQHQDGRRARNLRYRMHIYFAQRQKDEKGKIEKINIKKAMRKGVVPQKNIKAIKWRDVKYKTIKKMAEKWKEREYNEINKPIQAIIGESTTLEQNEEI